MDARSQALEAGAAVNGRTGLLAALCLSVSAAAQFVLEPELPKSVQSALEAPGLTEMERRDLRLRHGLWTPEDLDTPLRRAEAALRCWRLQDPSLSDPSVPVATRAEAVRRQGRAVEAESLLAGCDDPEGALVRARALAMQGKVAEATEAFRRLETLAADPAADAAALRRGAEAVIDRGALEPVPADRWKQAADWLGRARELDRLDPSVPAVEGRLLVDRHNPEEGVPALQQAVGLDHRSAWAMHDLGRASLAAFDFDGAARAAAVLRRCNPEHPLADLLDVERLLLTEDVDGASKALDGLQARWPDMPEAMALRAAVAARRWDEAGVDRALQDMDAHFPGQALGAATAGRLLSLHRQYAWAERLLRRAIERRPAWSMPRGELGQLMLQTGRDDEARQALREASDLDPFDKRSAFGRWLLDEMAGYRTIDTPHFRIRVKSGVDEVVAEGMPEALESMHREVTGWFGHEPSGRTTIEVLPDHAFFGVRITGMPGIHTMAASTGPVIAMEVPRRGNPRKHLGTFDWLEVLRHEYTHTVTLSQTDNRIPHWFTEALAVRLETKPRTMQTCELLARALSRDRLFPLDRIKWAFVRPETPQDRPLAYAQGHWMVEYIESRWGRPAIPALLARYRAGDDEPAAMRAVLGMGSEEFFRDFKVWARGQVAAWGLAASPSIDECMEMARQSDPSLREKSGEARLDRVEAVAKALAERSGAPASGNGPITADRWPAAKLPAVHISDALLDGWLAEQPTHPDLLELKIRRRMKEQGGLNATTRELLAAYAKARPVDPWPDLLLAAAARSEGHPEQALTHLQRLDALEERDPAYAIELAGLFRAAGRLPEATRSVEKAARMDGYDPATQELAAAIAVEAGDLPTAMRHLRALQRLEPDVARHAQRIERLQRMIDAGPAPAP